MTTDPKLAEIERLRAALRDPVDEERFILGQGQIDEDGAKAKFRAAPELRLEFAGSEEAYLAYLRAVSRGEVQTVQG